MNTEPAMTTQIPRTAFSMAEAEISSGMSRATLYRLIAAGKLQTVRRGGRRLVPAAELARLCSPDAMSSVAA